MYSRFASLLLWASVAGLAGAALAPSVALAQSTDAQAEKFRLTEEMKRLAQRNAWPGVEAKYAELQALKVPLEFSTHRLAAQSAQYLGKTFEQYNRLTRAYEVEADDDVKAEMEAIDAKYGRVRLIGNERWQVTLRRPAMPFAPDERKSVEYAILVASESGGFTGMLPAGDYIIGEEDAKVTVPFTVAPGAEFQEIVISRDVVSSSEGLIVYHGPIAMAGYSFSATPAPSGPITRGDGSLIAAPSSKSGSGFTGEVGYEVGFTRLFAVGATFDYRNLITGADQFHAYTGALYAFIRPGDLRIGVAGIYGRWAGQGSGVYEHFDIGQDLTRYPLDETVYDGESWAGGAKLSVAYGLLDFGSLQGVVELGGTWQTDGDRNYMSGGLRVGIVPKVPRFRE